MTVLKSGLRLKSAVCDTELMVIRAPAGVDVDIRCGGAPMLSGTETASGAQLDPALSGGALIGKRYVDAAETFELLCTKGGKGSLVLNGTPLEVKIAKALPSSD
jgi:hypothetical protein